MTDTCSNINACATKWKTDNDYKNSEDVCKYKSKLECYKDNTDTLFSTFREKYIAAHTYTGGGTNTAMNTYSTHVSSIRNNISAVNTLKGEVSNKVNTQLDSTSGSSATNILELNTFKDKIQQNTSTDDTSAALHHVEKQHYIEKLVYVIGMFVGVGAVARLMYLYSRGEIIDDGNDIFFMIIDTLFMKASSITSSINSSASSSSSSSSIFGNKISYEKQRVNSGPSFKRASSSSFFDNNSFYKKMG
jgi:hypothetical protein